MAKQIPILKIMGKRGSNDLKITVHHVPAHFGAIPTGFSAFFAVRHVGVFAALIAAGIA